YRKVWNTGEVVTRPFADASGRFATVAGARTSTERVGLGGDAVADAIGAARAGFVYDAYNTLVSRYYGSIDAFAAPSLPLGADYDHDTPTFDGASIWTWFPPAPVTTAPGRAAFAPRGRFDFAASAGVRRLEVDDDAPQLSATVAGAPAPAAPGA